MDNQSKEFKELQKKWYAKASDSGFEDIEQTDGNLKKWHSSLFATTYNAETAQAKEEYYRLARQFLHDYKFKTKLEFKIWELHSEGMSIRNIAKTLKKKRFKTGKWKTHTLLKALVSEMIQKCSSKRV